MTREEKTEMENSIRSQIVQIDYLMCSSKDARLDVRRASLITTLTGMGSYTADLLGSY